jgi:hypothetical protein
MIVRNVTTWNDGTKNWAFLVLKRFDWLNNNLTRFTFSFSLASI